MGEKLENNVSEKQTGFEKFEHPEKLPQPDAKEKEGIKDRIEAFFERKMSDPKVQKKVLIASALVDLVGGWATAQEVPKQKQEADFFPKTEVVSVIDAIDIRSKEAENHHSESDSKDIFTSIGKAVENIGNDESTLLGYLEDKHKIAVEENDTIEPINSENNPPEGEKQASLEDILAYMGYEIQREKIEPSEHSFEDKIQEVDWEPIDDKNIVDSFLNGEYKTVEATEDIIAYRVYGGGSEKEGNPNGEFIFLTPREPRDRIVEKLDSALTNKWQGEIKDEEGKPKYDENGEPLKSRPNTREYYCEVYIPKGTHMNVGKVAPQETLGGQLLEGGGEQIVLSKDGLSFGEGKEIHYWGHYLDFEKTAQKIEREEK